MAANTARACLLQLRLSADELEQMRVRAAGEPVSTWLRRLALDLPAPKARRHLVRERPLHPQSAELIRAALLARGELRRLATLLADHELPPAQAGALIEALTRIDASLRHCREAAQC